MFRLSPAPFDTAELHRKLTDAHAGACVVFEGWIRDRNERRQVISLEYDAYAALVEKEGSRILTEAREKFSVLDAICVHRSGHLRLGEIAVWVGVTAEHRGMAFDACRYIIDQAKIRLPIWKKEHYTEGSTAWINCAAGLDG